MYSCPQGICRRPRAHTSLASAARAGWQSSTPSIHHGLVVVGSREFNIWLRTNGVNTSGAAAKVTNYDRLGGTKSPPLNMIQMLTRCAGVLQRQTSRAALFGSQGSQIPLPVIRGRNTTNWQPILRSSGMWCLRIWCQIIIDVTLSYTYVLHNIGSHNYYYQTPNPQTPHP